MRHLRSILILAVFALSVAALPYAGLPYYTLNLSARYFQGYETPLPDFVPPAGVGVEDVQIIAFHWGTDENDEGEWDDRFDLNFDGQITIADIMRACGSFGLS